MNGTIKKKTDRGFGFISQADNGPEIFFHANDLRGITFDELQEGMQVTFETKQGNKGVSAINVEVVQ